ncbi:alpha/beta fold hydrolase [Oceanococcus atlanticus]|uniref:alpha/beta fold hydrolase n=1 Tax=Oceanococcus atlanticus TaxID=1317117 RepID=UPI0009F8F01E|nr:alpha/beta hydrolase [Oceanococcus atlanticus]
MNFQKSTFQLWDGPDLNIWSNTIDAALPNLHFAHATGFSALTYLELFRRLEGKVNIDAWDMRGHGINRHLATNDLALGWETYYRDLSSYLYNLKEPTWLVGHSIGATTSLAAATRLPEKVNGLILCDPVLLPLKDRLMLRLAKWTRRSQSFGLALSAKRRRRQFGSHAEALQNFRAKQAFRSWPDQWLDDYVTFAFHETKAGHEISCPPDWEAQTFGHTEDLPWRHVSDVGKPLIILAGEHGSTFPHSEHKRLMHRVRHSNIHVLPQTSHFLPMERPDEVANVILSAIQNEHVHYPSTPSRHQIPGTLPSTARRSSVLRYTAAKLKSSFDLSARKHR